MIHELEHWLVQSSSAIASDGRQLSLSDVDPSQWYSARLPATVLAVLVAHGVHPDPFVGEGFLQLPGRGPAHQNFSNHPMPEDSPFRVPWWFLTELPEPARGRHTWLELDGLNYRANLFVNGALVADCAELVGAYRKFELLLDPHLRPGKNRLALQIFPPNPDDLALTWVDWNPSPPDKNLGLWRPARLRSTGALRLAEVQVRSSLPEPDLSLAELEVFATVENASHEPVRGCLELCFEGRTHTLELELGARERRELCFGGREFPALRVNRPQLWWPRGRGEQPLHQLRLLAKQGGVVSDRRELEHGIRQVTCELTDAEHSLFRINGKPILIRGGGWARDMLLRSNAERELYEYEYVKDLGLNTIRFEGMVESNEFLRRCDQDGMLVIGGFCCCDHWEKWDSWQPADLPIAEASLRSELRRLRNHACMLAWWYGSDFPPPEHVEQRYLSVLAEERWPNPAHSSAAAKPTPLTGPSGMKMAGPYDYVPPNYWLEDTERGGAFGFATEIGPGPAIPPIETLRSMLGEAHLWPPDECWTLHSGGGPFKERTLFDTALSARYGPATGVEDYCYKAQLACYEAERAMFEAYARRKYRATGVIQWMLNNAWPSLIWHLWDHSLRTAGGYFGAKKACEPLHIQYDAGEETVSVVSELSESSGPLQARCRLFELEQQHLHERFRHEVALEVPADGVTTLCRLPDRRAFGELCFLLLELQGTRSSRNLYWLSRTPDVIDHAAANWYMAPLKGYANFQALEKLAAPTLRLELLSQARTSKPNTSEPNTSSSLGLGPQRDTRQPLGPQRDTRQPLGPQRDTRQPLGPQRDARTVRLHNDGASLAFFVRLTLVDALGSELLPTLYSDNYISLLPGECWDVSLSARQLPPGARVRALAGPGGATVAAEVALDA